MISAEYRKIIANITRNVLNKKFPGLKKSQVDDVGREVAINIHARMYGANVDGVDSPIWSVDRNGSDRMQNALANHKDGFIGIKPTRGHPNKDAKDLLND